MTPKKEPCAKRIQQQGGQLLKTIAQSKVPCVKNAFTNPSLIVVRDTSTATKKES